MVPEGQGIPGGAGSAAAEVDLQAVGRRFDTACRRCGREISLLRVPSGWVPVERGGNVRHYHFGRRRGVQS